MVLISLVIISVWKSESSTVYRIIINFWWYHIASTGLVQDRISVYVHQLRMS